MKGEWLRAAMADDRLVAELLLRLKQPDSHPAKPTAALVASLPPLDWGMRLPRSKAGCSLKKEREATRRSPTTPLSWSAGGGSPSDSCDESSRPFDRFVLDARSKGIPTTNTANSITGSKRPRRKKTLAELKEEESSLLKEMKHLKKELDTVRTTLEEQRSYNENLKRIKLDLHAQLVSKSVPDVHEHNRQLDKNNCSKMKESTSDVAIQSNVLKQVKSEDPSESLEVFSIQNGAFVLPDLNMTPEDDWAPETKA